MKSFRIIFPAALGVILLVIIIIKAVCIPITYDEVSTGIHYTQYSVWQVMMYPDNWPNNHILNTLAVRFSMHFFGTSPFNERLPNVLCFILYFTIVWSIANRYFKESILYYAVFACFLCNPYFLDFFGLARGYAMSCTFMLTSVFFFVRFITENKFRFFWLSFFFGILAAYANFTLLLYLAAIDVLLFFGILIQLRLKRIAIRSSIISLAILFLLNAAFATLIYTPIHKMQSTNQFMYWTSNGFIRDTIKSLIDDYLYGVTYPYFLPALLLGICIALSLLMSSFAILEIYRRQWNGVSNLFLVAFTIFLFTFTVNIIQNILLKTPNLFGRTALLYYPLFTLSFMLWLKEIKISVLFKTAITIFLVCSLLIHQARATTFKYVYEWEYDKHTYDVIKYLDSYRKEHNLQTVPLNTSWWFNLSMAFYQTTADPWISLSPYHKEVDTTSNTLFYYATDDDAYYLVKHYNILLDFDGGKRKLLIHK